MVQNYKSYHMIGQFIALLAMGPNAKTNGAQFTKISRKFMTTCKALVIMKSIGTCFS